MIEKYFNKNLDDVARIEKLSFNNPWPIYQFKNYSMNLIFSMSYIYKIGNKVVGYLMGQVILNVVHIQNIAVEKNQRNKSIAKEMIFHLIDESKKKNINKLCLEVNSSNIFALKLYNSIGFYKTGEKKEYYEDGKDAILMDFVI